MSANSQTYDLSLLDPNRARWIHGKGLREVYKNIFAAMHQESIAGPHLEIGCGVGAMKDFYPKIVSSDVAATPYAQEVISAYEIPKSRSWTSIFAMDVFHHLCRPCAFLKSAADALSPGGRIILSEPAATFGGRIFYRLFHHEPMQPSQILFPYEFRVTNDTGEYANMAAAWAIFVRDYKTTERLLREMNLCMKLVAFRDLLAYPLSGGFSSRERASVRSLIKLLDWERSISQRVLRSVGLRMLIVLEKSENTR